MDTTININPDNRGSDTKQNPPAEEYRAPIDDINAEYSEPPSAKVKNLLQKINQPFLRRLLIPIGLVVAIFILYQVLGLFSRKTQETETKTPERVATAVMSTAASSTAIQQMQPPPQPIVDEKMTKELATMAEREQQSSSNLSRMETLLNSQQAALATLNKSLADISQSVALLTKNVDSVMAAQKAVKKKPHKIKRKVPRIKKNVYHVKAIVPGRAWVEDARGFTVTVRVGDILNGGKVEMISPSQGMVVLSTGEIIQYGANDF